MGNCVKKQSPIQSDRGLPVKSPPGEMFISGMSQVQIKPAGDRGSGDMSFTEVKIKISKKQLVELLGRTDVQGLTVQQVLAHLMNVSDRFESQHHRSWRPALQSIPE